MKTLMLLLVIVALLVPSLAVAANDRPAIDPALQPLLHALWQVEASGRLNPPDGDGGDAIGPLQIHEDYWYDATHDAKDRTTHPGTYADCRDLEYAKQVVVWYWQRYCPRTLARHDFKTLSRVHNGGPGGAAVKATLAYWAKVQKCLPKES